MPTGIFGGLKSLSRALGVAAISMVSVIGPAGAGDIVGQSDVGFQTMPCAGRLKSLISPIGSTCRSGSCAVPIRPGFHGCGVK